MSWCGWGEEWPYSNYDRTNLNWIIREVGKLKKEVEEVQSFFDNISQQIADEVAKATAELSAKVDLQLAQNLADVKAIERNLNAQMIALSTQFQQLLIKHNADIANLQEEIEKLKVDVPDYQNPESGEMQDLQTIINFLYYNINADGILTVDEIIERGLTVDEIIALNLTCYDIARNGYELWKKE